MVYEDQHLAITETAVVVKRYYIPLFRSKTIPFEQIASVRFHAASVVHGRFRIMGTGDGRTWYAWDHGRMHREGVFVFVVKDRWIRAGCSADDCGQVRDIFRNRGLLETE